MKIYAWGIRNCVGEAINPITGELWCSTNERDGLGNNLVPDYVTHVQEGGFYGWPWWYMGGHQDPRHEGKHPELQSKVITPDILVNPHFASLEMIFYEGSQFPADSKATASPASTARGTAPSAPATKSSACPCTTATRPANTKTSSPASPIGDGDVWGRPVGVAEAPTALSSSPTTAQDPSGT